MKVNETIAIEHGLNKEEYKKIQDYNKTLEKYICKNREISEL